MNHEKLNSRLQILANLGIVAGLVLVGVQLKQNSDLLKMQLLYEESQRSMDIETQVVGENAAQVWARSLTDAGNLTLAEQRVMEALLWSYTENLRATHMLSELGLLEENEWKQRVNADSAFYLANGYGIAWWINYSSDSDLPAELTEAINARLAKADPNFTSIYMRSIMENLRKAGPAATNGAASSDAVPQADTPAARVRAARARFNRAIEDQNPAALDGLFAPDYQLITGRSDRYHGAQAQLELWQATFRDDPTFNCQRTADEVIANEGWGLAQETGHWVCTQTVDGEPGRYIGVYAAKWQRATGSHWVLQSEVFTTLACDGTDAACRPPDPIL